MDSHERAKRTDAGSVARMLKRLREIVRGLSPDRRDAMRKWTDAQEKDHENQDRST
jgi:hypothetical protein